ncbi:hypothetical protein [Pseudohongiella spirulinae]|uniref:DUF4760 domain-containing protein n=1 Tax=Pseudohongiella spirulinae TaxID=1249552 RepID=A0A0S2KBR9_9GAMM|nr:hypothetical protein [Pseudohongiella spirulinae]ALO45754.1 hypothetical protein PS2015_1092 [Pseudohongiella spirulinae]
MNLEDLGNIGELIAAIATIATLVYLALQIRQNNDATRISAGQSILSSLNESLQVASSSPQTARVLILGQSDFETLPDDEKAQFTVWVFSWFRVLEQGEYYHRKGYLEDEVWQGHVEHLKQIMKSDAVAQWWESRHHFFNDDFQALVNEARIAETEAKLPRDVIEKIIIES